MTRLTGTKIFNPDMLGNAEMRSQRGLGQMNVAGEQLGLEGGSEVGWEWAMALVLVLKSRLRMGGQTRLSALS